MEEGRAGRMVGLISLDVLLWPIFSCSWPHTWVCKRLSGIYSSVVHPLLKLTEVVNPHLLWFFLFVCFSESRVTCRCFLLCPADLKLVSGSWMCSVHELFVILCVMWRQSLGEVCLRSPRSSSPSNTVAMLLGWNGVGLGEAAFS